MVSRVRKTYGAAAGAWLSAGLAVTARVACRAAETESLSSRRLVENLQRKVARPGPGEHNPVTVE